jgi:hypothetical protein
MKRIPVLLADVDRLFGELTDESSKLRQEWFKVFDANPCNAPPEPPGAGFIAPLVIREELGAHEIFATEYAKTEIVTTRYYWDDAHLTPEVTAWLREKGITCPSP